MHNRTALVTTTLISSFLVSTGLNAQTWGGFYADGALGARGTTTDVDGTLMESYAFSDPLFSYSYSRMTTTPFDAGKTNFLGQLSAGWRWDNGKIVVGIGGFVDLASDDAGKKARAKRFLKCLVVLESRTPSATLTPTKLS